MAYEDEEQLEKLRNWWRQYGRTVVVGVLAGVAAVVGWQQWQAWEARQATAAAQDYAAVITAINQGDVEAADNRLTLLRDDHAGSPSAVMATLAVATAELADGRADTAADLLAWVSEERADSPLTAVARLRHAEALAAAGRDDEALAATEPAPDGPLLPRYLELRGDLLVAQGDRDGAIAAYQEALERAPGQRRSVLELKLNDLGGVPAS